MPPVSRVKWSMKEDHLALQNEDNMFPQYGGNYSPSDSASYDRTESSIPSPAQYQQSIFQFKTLTFIQTLLLKYLYNTYHKIK